MSPKPVHRKLFFHTIAHDEGEVNSTTGCVLMVVQERDVSVVMIMSHGIPRKVYVLPKPGYFSHRPRA